MRRIDWFDAAICAPLVTAAAIALTAAHYPWWIYGGVGVLSFIIWALVRRYKRRDDQRQKERTHERNTAPRTPWQM